MRRVLVDTDASTDPDDLMALALLPEDGDEGAAARFVAETVAADPGEMDVVAIGPLTNLALALDLAPALPEQVRGLWVMGGDFSAGPACFSPAEHDVRSDAAAAATVLGSRAPTVLTGLDVTRQVATTRVAVGVDAAAARTVHAGVVTGLRCGAPPAP